jgi:hypothetical protein
LRGISGFYTVATEEQLQKFIIQHGKELGEYLTNLNKKAESPIKG